MKKFHGVIAFGMLFLATGAALADGYSNVAINGNRLTYSELAATERQIGSRIAPGSYVYNAYNGCWFNMSSGQQGCLNGSGGGGGRSGSNVPWTRSMGDGEHVGSDGNGCYYAGSWSNC